MPDQNQSKGGSPGDQGKGGSGDGAGGSGGNGAGAWLDTFPTIKSNAELAARLGSYESPEVALTKLATEGWGPDWRERYAGGDAAKLRDLQRYQDPGAALGALTAAQARIREGNLGKPLPEKPTPQELAEYRALHGVPEDAAKYFENLPAGVVIGEEDKPLFESVATKVLHKHNIKPAVLQDLVKWWGEEQVAQAAVADEQDAKDQQETEDALRNTWGQEFRQNHNIMKSYLSGLPAAVSTALQHARDADGRALFNNPALVQWVVATARELQDVSTLLDGGGGSNPLVNVEQELKKIDDFRRKDRKAYNKDEAMQQRERDLIDQQNRLKQRKGAA